MHDFYVPKKTDTIPCFQFHIIVFLSAQFAQTSNIHSRYKSMSHSKDKPDNVTGTPSTLPYAHHAGSALIKPVDKGKVKGRALMAMEEQTHMQMDQIREQIELLASQAKALQDRIDISEKIYQAEVNFEPLISHTYHLYEKTNGTWTLSMVGPDDWGRSFRYAAYLATVKLLADHTWEILQKSDYFNTSSGTE